MGQSRVASMLNTDGGSRPGTTSDPPIPNISLAIFRGIHGQNFEWFNPTRISLAQLPLIGQLLKEISRNPLQLFQQRRGNSARYARCSEQWSNQAPATAAAAVVAGTALPGEVGRTGDEQSSGTTMAGQSGPHHCMPSMLQTKGSG
ncbi:hypothetical protein D915_001820 [Fasciola hepatica]|uniref:Uncharacterized protein n=1 Tax=Fasciola hepatica TaxID=6192 RepID=A0A4E0RHL7_FASHE|nr:hypothetical protein D915_001820 [Fasciola hepatica]